MNHLCIEEETRIMDKCGKVGSSVHHLSTRGSGHKGKFVGVQQKSLGSQKFVWILDKKTLHRIGISLSFVSRLMKTSQLQFYMC
uniref:Uncharacterized protein n=1 Tax=Lactuca sativa TaxID=4236 RepID=A0A9R1VZ76_LACSA|nr:hypothetical protein LSAT_V11C300132240 [Lactuca sativa]